MSCSRRTGLATGAIALALLAAPSFVDSSAAHAEAEAVGGPVTPTVFEGSLRDLPTATKWRPGDPVREIPRKMRRPALLPNVDPLAPHQPVQDPLLEIQSDSPAPLAGDLAVVLNQDGQGYTGVTPPDPTGDVGPDYYIQAINAGGGSELTVYNKDGSVETGPILMDSLGSGNCASGAGDPIILYDPLAERWLLTEFAFEGFLGGVACVYVSRTSDPVDGGWFAYEFDTTNFPDYPKYAVMPQAYFLTSNENSPAIYALDRERMLAGQTTRSLQRFTVPGLSGFGFNTTTPADFDGTIAPPADAPGIIGRHRDDESHSGSNNPNFDFIELWEFDVDFNNANNSTLTQLPNIAISEFDSNLCGLTSFSCIEQPGSQDLDPLREVLMWRLQYRNFGSHEALIGNLVTDVDGNNLAGIRWFELRKTGGSWSLFQEGTYSIDNFNRWMGSASMDKDGNLLVAYNVASQSLEPGLRFAGRLESDAPGTLTQGEFNLVGGGQSNSSNRYGDYSAMTVDPADDCTFWFTAQYNPSGMSWGTRMASFRFSSCETAALPTIDSIVPCTAGVDNTWSVSGATPNGSVRVTCDVLATGATVTLGTSTANSAGNATVVRNIPGSASGFTLQCQAQDLSTGLTSTPVLKTFP